MSEEASVIDAAGPKVAVQKSVIASPDTPAHSQKVTYTVEEWFPAHLPRKNDPHYRVFDATRKRLKRLGKLICWRCGVKEGDLLLDEDGHPTTAKASIELHHSVVEYSLANAVDIEEFGKLYPELHVEDDETFLQFVESEGNLLPLCVSADALITVPDGTVHLRDICNGDMVIGSDGQPHRVTGTWKKMYSGEVVRLDGGAVMTPDHPVLTRRGWLPASCLRPNDSIYTIPDQACGVPLGTQCFVAKMHNVVPLRTKVGIALRVILHAISVPFHAVNLNDLLACIEHTGRRPVYNMGRNHTGGFGAKGRQATTTIRRASLNFCDFARPERKWLSADFANQHDSRPWLSSNGRWEEVGNITLDTVHNLEVRDISVEGSHSFVANGVVVHNCVKCHRGRQGIHCCQYPGWLLQRFAKRGVPALVQVVKGKEAVA